MAVLAIGFSTINGRVLSKETLQSILNAITIRIESGDDLKVVIKELINVIQELYAELERTRERDRFLEGELQKRKREKSSQLGAPGEAGDHRAKKNHSSENRRKGDRGNESGPPGRRGRKSKADLVIDETRRCTLDRGELPPDAQYKGVARIVMRELVIEPRNIEFEREVYYSPSEGKRYMAPLPPGWEGEFGPALKTGVVTLKYDGGMSESGIVRFLQGHEFEISSGSVSNILLRSGEFFHEEKSAIMYEGYRSGSCAQSDDTAAKVMGKHWHTHVVCNETFTAYFTREGKDRMTVIDVLLGREASQRRYRYTGLTAELLKIFGVSELQRERLAGLVEADLDYDEEGMNAVLSEQFGEKAGSAQAAASIREAMALSHFHEQDEIPFPETLVTDAAPQYELLALHHAACWIHDGRHYEKLEPLSEEFREELERFRKRYWKLYHELAAWRDPPKRRTKRNRSQEAKRLEGKFDRLFGTRSGYRELEDRIAKTRAKKEKLLVVLKKPQVPLHNNASELGARRAARRRDISLHSRSVRGVDAMDALTTVVETCRKIGVRVGQYIFDRFCGLRSEEGLSSHIASKSAS